MAYRTSFSQRQAHRHSSSGSSILGGLGAIFLVVLACLAILTLTVGISAFFAWLAMLLWNFIAVGIGHASWQLGFYVCWAGMTLLSLLTNPFRVVVRSKS